jgi:hypothetical protein
MLALAMLRRFGLTVLVALVGVLGLHLPRGAPPAAAATRPVPAIKRALIVSIDGLRSDALLRADAPTLRGLMAHGSFTLWARTTAVAVTLPSHVSMLTGVPPGKHGIEWNTVLPLSKPVYPAWPTLFELARAAGYTTAMVAGKAKFSALEKPGSLNWSFVPGDVVITDRAVADTASSWIARFAPEVLFVHLPSVDSVGHAKGWGSPEQLEAIGVADRCVREILDALGRKRVRDATVVIVSTDHGGAGRSHGADDPRSREIPWIASGPGIAHDRDLTLDARLDVDTEDTFATVCWLLGITPSKPIDGRPVTQILASTRWP